MTTNWKNPSYYYFPDDLEQYPDCWCYIVWSRRGAGKTYSALRYAYENKIPIAYMKRTNDDVNMICGNRGGVDLSPYVPINRDCGTHITSHALGKGIGAFYDELDEKGNPIGAPFSYICSLNAMKSVKGFDLSICDWMLLDEFIPQTGEIVRRLEGDMLLDMYMTISRDRIQRGRDDLKLILFANAENISTPITRTLGIVDDMYQLQESDLSHMYLLDRGILLHQVVDVELPEETTRSGIYKAMADTEWGLKSFGGEFSSNDFSNVKKVNLKNYVPVVAYTYKKQTTYIYRKEELLYFTTSPNDRCEVYNLNRENEQKKFYYDYIFDFQADCIEERVKFQRYSMYDLIMNYKSYFTI